jgi:hypothetical protein
MTTQWVHTAQNILDCLRACLVRVRVEPFWGFWRMRRSSLIALFDRNASETEEAVL